MTEDVFFRSNKTSVDLEWILSRCSNYDDFEKQCSADLLNSDCRTSIYLMKLLDKYRKKASVVSQDAKLAQSYVGHIINGVRNPSRDILLRICFAVGTTVEETQYLLKYAGYAPLYVRRKRDVIIWFGLSKGETLDTVNENLVKYELEPLFDET